MPPPLPKEQDYILRDGFSTNQIKIERSITIKPESQTWATVSNNRSGLIIIDPLRSPCKNHDCIADTRVHQAQPGKEFYILIGSLSRNHFKLVKDQSVATAEDHPETLTETDISNGELLGIVDSNNKYRKSEHSTRDVNLLNQHFCGCPGSSPR